MARQLGKCFAKRVFLQDFQAVRVTWSARVRHPVDLFNFMEVLFDRRTFGHTFNNCSSRHVNVRAEEGNPLGRAVRERVQSRVSVDRNEVQFREGKAPAEPCVSAVQWLGRSLALPS